MSITQDQLWSRMKTISKDLYDSGNNYVASIYKKMNTVTILKILPKDKNENVILNIVSIMSINMSKDKSPLHLKCGNGFTCSLIHRKDDEFIFITKRETSYISTEEIICNKYSIDPTLENQQKVKTSIEGRIYSYKQRDLKKANQCITIEEAKKLEDYKINMSVYDMFNEDIELQKIRHLNGKKISELSLEEEQDILTYISSFNRPVALTKSYISFKDKKILFNKLPEIQTITYKEACDIIIGNNINCNYCDCKMTLLNTKYNETSLSFDAIIPLYGHKKDNITLCCTMCNSKKSFKNKL